MTEKAQTPGQDGVLSNFDSLYSDETDSEVNSLIDGGNSTRSTPHNQQEFSTAAGSKGFNREFATFFKWPDKNEPQGGAAVRFQCSPSLTLSRDLNQRRKTILNTFCLLPKTKYDEDVYKLYQHTISKKAEALYSSALDAFEEEKYEEALSYIQKALIMSPDNPTLYTLRGEVYLRMCDYNSAIINYKRVCILNPEDDKCFSKLAFIYYLQGQCYYDEQLYLDALECFTRASEMEPKNSSYHSRSIACLVSLKRHKDCMKMINQRLEIESENPDLLVLRARLHLIFSNPTLAFFDVKVALEKDPANYEAGAMSESLESKAELSKDYAVKLDMTGKTKEAILKITFAIETNPEVTSYYLLRAAMHRRNFDFNASVDDLLLVMDKQNYDSNNPIFVQAQKQLILTFNDFAVDCFRKEFYEEAVVLLEKAIQGEKNEALLYINRGDCFYKLNYLHFALLDYQQAQELESAAKIDNKSVSHRLSIVYNQLGVAEYADRKYYRAEDYFSLAIAHNCRNPYFYLSRARSRYMQEKTSEAQVDVLSGLTLDKDNKEICSIFVRLFPCQTVDEVMRSEFGKLVQQALDEVIEENSPEKSKDTLSKKKPLNQINTRSCVIEKMEQCMKDQEFHAEIIKGKKKVNELVEKVIQSRQNLNYEGPRIAKVAKPRSLPDSPKRGQAT